MAVSDAQWDGSASGYSDEQWARACILDRGGDGTAKERYGLPIREPGGALNRNGVHAAAARINQAQGPPAALARAKGKLRAAYAQLGESPPDVVAASQDDLFIVAFAGTAGEDASQPFEILRAGKFIKGGRTIEVTSADLDKAVENFKASQSRGGDIPTDFDHSFVHAGDSRASGWYTEMTRKGASLFARVRWTDRAKELIGKQEYRFFSPEFTKNAQNEYGKDEGFAVISGTLTNRPFLRGMTPVALSQEVEQAAWQWAVDRVGTLEDEVGELKSERRSEALDEMSDDKSKTDAEKAAEVKAKADADAAVVAASQKAEADKAAAEQAAAEKKDEGTIALSQAEVTDLRAKAGKVEALSTRVETLEKDLAGERFKASFSQAMREGRVDAKDETRTKWADRFEKFGQEEASALLFELPAEVIPMSERGAGKDAPGLADGATDRDALNARIEALAAEKNISYVEALDQIADEVTV